MVGFEASVQRTGARWRARLQKQEESVSREVRARFQRFKRESCTQARCFKLSGFGHRPQAAGPISVRMGRSPACTATFARHMITRHLIFNSFRERYTQAFISVINMQDAKV